MDDTGPPLPVVTDKVIWLPTWPESHDLDVDSSGPSVIDVPDFLPEFRRFREGVIKMNLSHRATRVKVHAGPHARRSRPGKALIDTGSMLASGAASPSAVQSVPANGSGLYGIPLNTGKTIRLNVVFRRLLGSHRATGCQRTHRSRWHDGPRHYFRY